MVEIRNVRKGRTTIRSEVRKDLYDQIERNGTSGNYYIDLIEDYMRLWDVKQDLLEDITERGSKVTKFDSRGQCQTVTNESIEHLLKVNKQMLVILDNLGIKAVEAESTSDSGVGCDL